MQPILGDGFDGGYFFSGGRADRGHARPDSLSVLMHGTGPTQRHAAAKLGSGQPQNIAHIPQQRQIGIAVVGMFYAVDFDLHHVGLSTSLSRYSSRSGRWKSNMIPLF